MSTRGLVGIKIGDNVKYVYNHFDSYPSGLMREIYERLQRCNTEEDYQSFKREIESGEFTNEHHEDFLNIKNIDYLYHEFVYILDFDKKRWSAYKSIWTENRNKPVEEWDTHKGYLKPLIKDIDFKQNLSLTDDDRVSLLR